MEYEVEGDRPRGISKKTWTEGVRKTVWHVNWTGRLPWIAIGGGSR